MSTYLREAREGVELLVLAQPRASRTRVLGVHEGRLKVAVASPPVDGGANAALLAFLSDALSVGKRALELVQGETGRRKTIRISGVAVADVREIIESMISPPGTRTR